jgi:hypothetical protein
VRVEDPNTGKRVTVVGTCWCLEVFYLPNVVDSPQLLEYIGRKDTGRMQLCTSLACF